MPQAGIRATTPTERPNRKATDPGQAGGARAREVAEPPAPAELERERADVDPVRLAVAPEEREVRARPAADVDRAAARVRRGETLEHTRDDGALPTEPPVGVLVREHVAVLGVLHRVPSAAPLEAEPDRRAHVLPAPAQETERRRARLRYAVRSWRVPVRHLHDAKAPLACAVQEVDAVLAVLPPEPDLAHDVPPRAHEARGVVRDVGSEEPAREGVERPAEQAGQGGGA